MIYSEADNFPLISSPNFPKERRLSTPFGMVCPFRPRFMFSNLQPAAELLANSWFFEMKNGVRPIKVFRIYIFSSFPFCLVTPALISMFLRQWSKYSIRILGLESGFCSGLYNPPCFHLEKRKPPGFSDANHITEINLDYTVLVKGRDFSIIDSIAMAANSSRSADQATDLSGSFRRRAAHILPPSNFFPNPSAHIPLPPSQGPRAFVPLSIVPPFPVAPRRRPPFAAGHSTPNSPPSCFHVTPLTSPRPAPGPSHRACPARCSAATRAPTRAQAWGVHGGSAGWRRAAGGCREGSTPQVRGASGDGPPAGERARARGVGAGCLGWETRPLKRTRMLARRAAPRVRCAGHPSAGCRVRRPGAAGGRLGR